MKSIPIVAGILIFSICWQGCVYTGRENKLELVEIKIGNDYSIDIPSFMQKTDNLNDEASLQFQNLMKETYVVVIDEDKQEFIDLFVEIGEYDSTRSALENYCSAQMLSLSEAVDVNFETKPASISLNGLSALQVEIDATVEGVPVDISYLFTFVEGHENLYMINAWTLKDRKEKYANVFKRMVTTFKEL